jgi:hypothetical protein
VVRRCGTASAKQWHTWHTAFAAIWLDARENVAVKRFGEGGPRFEGLATKPPAKQ